MRAKHYVFELKQLQELKEPVHFTFQEEEFLETSPERLLELQREYQKDPVGYVTRSIEQLRKRNNPLELE